MVTSGSAISLRTIIAGAVVVVALSRPVPATTLPVVRQFAAPGTMSDGMTLVEGDLWIWDGGRPSYLYVLDPDTGNILSTHPAPPRSGPTGLAYDGQSVWAVAGLGAEPAIFSRLDPADGSVLGTYDVPVVSPTGITYDGTHLWISETDGYQVIKLEPATMQVVGSFNKPWFFSRDLAWDGESLWLASGEFATGGLIHRINPATGQVLATYEAPGGYAGGLTIDRDLLYVSNSAQGQIYVLQIPEPGTLLLAITLAVLAGKRERVIR